MLYPDGATAQPYHGRTQKTPRKQRDNLPTRQDQPSTQNQKVYPSRKNIRFTRTGPRRPGPENTILPGRGKSPEPLRKEAAVDPITARLKVQTTNHPHKTTHTHNHRDTSSHIPDPIPNCTLNHTNHDMHIHTSPPSRAHTHTTTHRSAHNHTYSHGHTH